MTAGPARPFVSVKFTPVGRTYSFLIPELALDEPAAETPALEPGAQVIVQTEAGPAFGTVTRTITPLASSTRQGAENWSRSGWHSTTRFALWRLLTSGRSVLNENSGSSVISAADSVEYRRVT